MILFLGGIFYIGLLLINAVAILSEDRFLARSACPCFMLHSHTPQTLPFCSRMVNRSATEQRRVSTKL